MAMDGAWCYEWHAAVRSGRDGEEGRAGGDVHCEQTMRSVCRTARLTLRYDTMGMLQLLDEKLHHFLSRRHMKVRYRYVALSQTQ
jgi:hypothetical protein